MKKIIFSVVCMLLLQTSMYAQVEKQIKGEAVSTDEKKKLADTTDGWKFGGLGSITFNQAGFVNWAPGGTNSFSFLFNFRFYADLKKKNHLWQNWFAAEYGIQFVKSDADKVRKNADRWEIFSKYGYKLYKPLYIAVYADLRSQFSNTYDYSQPKPRKPISRFAAPLIFESAVGLDYVPNQYFSLFYSPLAAKITFVGDNDIAVAGTYGNTFPSKLKKEFGTVLIATYKQNFWKQNISILSVFKAYKNYLRDKEQVFDFTSDPATSALVPETISHYRRNIDIDWQTTIGLKVNKYLSASVFLQLVWDVDVATPVSGTIAPVQYKPQAQFRDIIGIGLSYNPNFYKAKGIKAKSL